MNVASTQPEEMTTLIPAMRQRDHSGANYTWPTWSPICCRALAIVAIATSFSGCASATYDPATGILSVDLTHRDPLVRIRALVVAERDGRHDLIPLLFDNLAHEEGGVRMLASTALRKLTGSDFDFKPYANLGDRAKVIDRWRAWWHGQGEGSDGHDETAPELP